jgi:hypothetical protein
MAFVPTLIEPIRRVALQNSIEPEALLAVVEIECGGRPFEADGITPGFLFERHVFFKQLAAWPAKQKAAIAQGLAIPKWSRATQYRDQGSSAGRAAVLDRARAVDAEAANRSCSWGIGQIMGLHAPALGYGSATAMVSQLMAGGVQAQIDCMLRFIKAKPGLVAKLNAHDWPGFAALYNGPAYALNDYDTRLANAHARWKLRNQATVPSPDAEDDIPLGRTPVQNAEPQNAWATPEGIATTVGAGTGTVGTLAAASKTEGPVGYALAFVIVAAFVVGAYFFLQRMKAHPA